MAEDIPRSRRVRFSLRTLMLFVIALGCGYALWLHLPVWQRRHVIQDPRAIRQRMQFSRDSKWLIYWLSAYEANYTVPPSSPARFTLPSIQGDEERIKILEVESGRVAWEMKLNDGDVRSVRAQPERDLFVVMKRKNHGREYRVERRQFVTLYSLRDGHLKDEVLLPPGVFIWDALVVDSATILTRSRLDISVRDRKTGRPIKVHQPGDAEFERLLPRFGPRLDPGSYRSGRQRDIILDWETREYLGEIPRKFHASLSQEKGLLLSPDRNWLAYIQMHAGVVELWRRRRPWSVYHPLTMPELWLTVFFGVLAVSSFIRDARAVRRLAA